MTSVQANRTLLHPADAKLLRVSLIYVLPGLAVFYVVLSGLWLMPDSLLGMYGNHDGHWASWNARGILEWGEFLDFSPISPLTGMGSPFLPNAVAQSGIAGPGDASAFASSASCFDARLSGGVVGVALSALPSSRVFGSHHVGGVGSLEYLSKDDDMLEIDLLERLTEGGELAACRHEGFWQCMDTLRDKQGLERQWLTGTPPWKRW